MNQNQMSNSGPLTPQILFEDTHLVVLSKPAGLLSQGEHTGDRNLVDELRAHFGRHYVGLVHRLDRNTSGVMVVAKRTKAAQRLSLALQKDEITRSYLGVCVGQLTSEKNWKHRLLKDPQSNTVRVDASGSEALLRARPIRSFEIKGAALTLVEFVLETGRSHQIRVQCAHEGYPLLGDPKYGLKNRNGNLPPFPRPALHSYRLRFRHPMSGEWLQFEAPLPADLRALIPLEGSNP